MRLELIKTLTEDEQGIIFYCLNKRTSRQIEIVPECFCALRTPLLIQNLESHLPSCTEEGKAILEGLIQKLKDENKILSS